MRVLLDTCTFIWLTAEPGRLSAPARAVLGADTADLLLSHVSVWEIYNKCSSDKLRLPDRPRSWVEDQLAARGVTDLPVDLASLGRMSELPLHHRDPFDRLLAAQALVHGLAMVTPDAAFDPYGVLRTW